MPAFMALWAMDLGTIEIVIIIGEVRYILYGVDSWTSDCRLQDARAVLLADYIAPITIFLVSYLSLET